jgi:DNA-binding beta-propeller fold protein YncE
VTPIRTATNTALKPITWKPGTAWGDSPIAITPNGKTAYVASTAGTVTPIRTATGKAGKPVKVGQWPDAVAITPNGKTVYVASTGSGPTGCIVQADCGTTPDSAASSRPATVTPISTATNRPGKPIKVGPAGSITIAITPNGKTAYVSRDRSTSQGHALRGFVIPIRTRTNTALGPIKVGYGPGPIAIMP